MIHMKCQVLFSLKNKVGMLSATILPSTLSVKLCLHSEEHVLLCIPYIY